MTASAPHRVILGTARARSGRHRPNPPPQSPAGRARAEEWKATFELDGRSHIQPDETGAYAR